MFIYLIFTIGEKEAKSSCGVVRLECVMITLDER